MQFGVSYFGVRNPQHFQRDLDDIARLGFTYIVFTFPPAFQQPQRPYPPPGCGVCPDRAAPCSGALRRGCGAALGAREAPCARRGRRRVLLGGAGGGAREGVAPKGPLRPKGRLNFLSAQL